MRTLFIILGVALIAVGCAKPNWNKPGASQDEFGRDRYACLQSSQQRVGAATVNKFGATATDEMQTNNTLFSSCMNARGWHLQQPAQATGSSPGAPSSPATDPIAAATREMNAGNEKACFEPVYQVLWAKSACKVKDITLSQRADTTRLADVDKPAFEQAAKELAERQRAVLVALRRAGGLKGQQFASLLVTAIARADAANMDLYVGKSTWGEYSKARVNNVRQFEAEVVNWRSQ